MRGSGNGLTRRTGRIAIGGALALLLVSAPAWADLKIGFVNYAMLMQQSPQAKAVLASLRREFASKQSEINSEQQALRTKEDELQRNGATMTVDQRTAAEQTLRDGQRQLSEKVNEYQDDFNARQNLEMSKVAKVVVNEVQQYARAQHFDLVLADGVIWANPTIDITQPVLAALQARGTADLGSSGGAATRSSRPRSRTHR
jgi:outer membrane protein